jgi:PPK2 family polyphosphate:nucleotide phosphotransferase
VKSHEKRFRVPPKSRVVLGDIDPNATDKHVDEASAKSELEADKVRMRKLQYLLYAERKHSMLICLQGLDASGKDGTVSHVLAGMNPQGARAHSFKVPSAEEAAHDFLWRAHEHAPALGEIAIFNRSHYEDVLVVRVHDLVSKDVWSRRYDRINEFETNLAESRTTILKFYLHISLDEQLRRFEQRLDDPTRQWKISEADYAERKKWPAYVEAYEDVFQKTSTKHAPWYIIPANHKWFRNLAVARIVVETLSALRMECPPPTVDIEEMRRKYHRASKDERRLEKKVAKVR